MTKRITGTFSCDGTTIVKVTRSKRPDLYDLKYENTFTTEEGERIGIAKEDVDEFKRGFNGCVKT